MDSCKWGVVEWERPGLCVCVGGVGGCPLDLLIAL